MKVPFLNLPGLHRELKPEFAEAFSNIIDTGMFSGGPIVEEFENEFAAYAGTAHAVGVGSGTDALRFALLALDIGPGSTVITVPNTFIATTEAISQTGAKIAFVDVDADTCLLDPKRLELLLERLFPNGNRNSVTSAIVPVHLYGQCVDMVPVTQLAKQYDLKILEDAAQAHGATYRGKSAGAIGNAAAFSFYPGKNLGALGEAGAVTTNDAQVAEHVRLLRDHGQKKKYHHSVEGYNGRLDAIQAAALKIKLKYLDKWNARRRECSDRYDEAFAKNENVKPVHVPEYNVPSRHLYVILSKERYALQQHLTSKGIDSGLHYPVPLHLQDCYSHLGYSEGCFPNAESIAGECLSLPMCPLLTDEQVDYVIDSVNSFRFK